ncbi:hypothetical protein BDV28DRAFT_139541 [Aspergillus coremiiformis]|uniref:DUF7729 domain-containing protein n=1 Tax=Aspergillus coremiiformis TaxID=138285 RepID=A0A5N6YZT9_9EURO|nr:hypothetical protein BDV28DRAFT_139541 [Aspergillus coremiiformis]
MRPCQWPSLRQQLLLMVIAAPSVVASVIPPVVRTDLESSVRDDLQDTMQLSDSPSKERAKWQDNRHEEDAASTPILVASEDDNHTHDGNVQSVVTRRATSANIPTPFDSNLSPNFTSDSCPKFFNKFLSDPKFTNCYALSMYLRDSSSFFQTLKSAAATSRLLDLACAADFNQCSSLMSDLASRITKSDACGKDYELGNPVVTNAYLDMVIYEPMYHSTCLKNPSTGDYCFVDAVSNTPNPADYDIYFLPYGSSITNPPYPTCSKCVQASMDIFSQWAQKSGQPLASSYLPTGKSINSKCGVHFTNIDITVASDATPSGTTAFARPHGLFTACVLVWSIGVGLWGWF